MKLILASLALILMSSAASADGYYFRLPLLYISDSSGAGTQSKSTRTLMDFGLGAITSGGWSYGLLYATDKVSSDSGTLDTTGLGPTFGWVSKKEMGPYILATYFIQLKRSDEYSGSGYQIDFGYKFPIKRFSFAFQLAMKSFTFDKLNGESVPEKYLVNKIDPYFVLWLDF